MAYCPRCDAENADNAIRCASCGAPMTSGTMVIAVPKDIARPKVVFRVVRADGGPETSVSMHGEVLHCGRAADIAFPDDPFVAQVQARFFFAGNRLAVEDLGGGNGVFIRLREERELSVGAEVRLGRQRLVLEAIPAPAPGPAGELAWGSPDPVYSLRLVQLLEGGGRGSAFPLKPGENLVGRETGDVTFHTDGFVSGRHAVVVVTGDQAAIRDVGSSNGTFARLSAPAYLAQGDQLLIGRELLRIEIA